MRDLPVRRLASTVLCASVLVGITGPAAVAADPSQGHDRAASRAPVRAAEKEKLLAQVRALGTAGSVLDPVVDLLNQSLEKGELPADEARRLGEAAKQAIVKAATDPKPAAPTAPAQATAPVRPSAHSQPPAPTQPAAQATPTASAPPAASAKPAAAAKPTAPASPATTVKPGAAPVPATSAASPKPATATALSSPTASAEPATSGAADTPMAPTPSPASVKPSKPTAATPTAPASPATSAKPANPTTAASPSAPAVSAAPAALTVQAAKRNADTVGLPSSRDLASDALSALQTAIDNLVKAVTGQLDQLLSSATDVVSGLVDLVGATLLGEDTAAPGVESLPSLSTFPVEPSQSATS
ncbi:hypothetical protein [Streptomyces olivaceoviridis]|uniref:hypothetical protein n=1 Tax=Streptomyces olivaceoviridis TaxID=1921 RepID=UPI00369CA682